MRDCVYEPLQGAVAVIFVTDFVSTALAAGKQDIRKYQMGDSLEIPITVDMKSFTETINRGPVSMLYIDNI